MISLCRRHDFIIRMAWTLSRLDLLYRFPSSTIFDGPPSPEGRPTDTEAIYREVVGEGLAPPVRHRKFE